MKKLWMKFMQKIYLIKEIDGFLDDLIIRMIKIDFINFYYGVF